MCVVALRAEQALAEAAASSREGPLAGIPFLVKDLARGAGMPAGYGSRLYAGRPPETADDTTVARRRAAGAIPIGKTNTPEFGWTAVTTNLVFGTTHNPWNPARSPGGSSGGSAAAPAAGLGCARRRGARCCSPPSRTPRPGRRPGRCPSRSPESRRQVPR